MKKLYIDVTQLMQWQGRLTGVPRVQHELISRFMDNPGTVFVTWHGFDFCEIDKAVIFNRQESGGSPEATQASLLARAKQLLGRSRLLKALYRRLRTNTHSITNSDAIVVPGVGDSFFVAEGIWSDDNYINKLVAFGKNGTKIIQVSYDMLPIVTPQFSGHSTEWLNNYARRVYPVCSLILSISEHTKRDVESWLKSQDLITPKIEVFRLGDNFKRSREIRPKNTNILANKFVLCVGTIEARKNHTLLYYAYKHALAEGIELPRLVIVGRKGWRAENIYDLMSTDPDITEHITILDNASDEELSWLYSHCLFTVYPSFYEGWGLPIAESLYYGVPCLASNTSSMPEVAGDLISYFDPTSPEDLLREMLTLLDPKKMKTATARAKQYKMASWDDSYKQVKKHILGEL